MGKFEIGQQVRVLEEIVNIYGIRGETGKILGFNHLGTKVHVQIFFPGTQSDDFWLAISSIDPAADSEGA